MTEQNADFGMKVVFNESGSTGVLMDVLSEEMGFATAFETLQKGEIITRKAWSGLGAWLIMVHPSDYKLSGLEEVVDPTPGRHIKKLPWVGMKTMEGCFVPWTPSQIDMMATDYVVLKKVFKLPFSDGFMEACAEMEER